MNQDDITIAQYHAERKQALYVLRHGDHIHYIVLGPKGIDIHALWLEFRNKPSVGILNYADMFVQELVTKHHFVLVHCFASEITEHELEWPIEWLRRNADMPKNDLPAAIRWLRKAFGMPAKQINNGWCAGFATQILAEYPDVKIHTDEELSSVQYTHTFLFYKGKYYDSETPDGVVNWLDLPIFCRRQRQLARFQQS
jgi:hypothetical protein